MTNMAVYAAIRQEAVKMKLLAFCFGMLDGTEQRFVLLELTVADRLRNSRQILVDNTSSADIQMSDFRVTHLTVWQAHRFTIRS